MHSVYDADKELPGEIGEESSGDSEADAQARGRAEHLHAMLLAGHQHIHFLRRVNPSYCQDHLLRAAVLARLFFCFVVSVR